MTNEKPALANKTS